MTGRRVRVVVVVDSRRGTVHGMTTDNEEAARWCRELAERHDDMHLAACQFVDVIPVRDDAWWED